MTAPPIESPVLAALSDQPLTADDVAAIAGLARDVVVRELRDLLAAGAVRRDESGIDAVWTTA